MKVGTALVSLFASIAMSAPFAAHAGDAIDESVPNHDPSLSPVSTASSVRFEHRLDDDLAVFGAVDGRARTDAAAVPTVGQRVAGGIASRDDAHRWRAEFGATEWAMPGAVPLRGQSALIESHADVAGFALRAGYRRIDPYASAVTGAQPAADGSGAFVGASTQLVSWLSLDTESRHGAGAIVTTTRVRCAASDWQAGLTFSDARVADLASATLPSVASVDLAHRFGGSDDAISGSFKASYAMRPRSIDGTTPADGFMQLDGAMRWGARLTFTASNAPMPSAWPGGAPRWSRDVVVGATYAVSRATAFKLTGRVDRSSDDAASDPTAQRVALQFAARF